METGIWVRLCASQNHILTLIYEQEKCVQHKSQEYFWKPNKVQVVLVRLWSIMKKNDREETQTQMHGRLLQFIFNYLGKKTEK